jgi:peptide/nickel transport system substrate-binding protein
LQQSPRKITVRATSQAPPSFGKDALGTGADLKLINKTSDTATYRLSFDLPSDVSGYQGLTLSDTLPDELAYQSDSGLAGAAATVNGQDLSWTLTQAQIAAAAGSTVSVDVTVKLSAAATSQDNGAVTNTAALHVDYDPSMPDPPADPDPATNTELEIGLPDAPSGFTKVKSDGDGILNSLEETAEYTISMNVPADVSEYASIVATDAVPSTLQIVGSPTTASGTASASGNTVTWTLDTPAQLADAAGKTITLTIPVRAAANATAADNGVITNTANTTVTFSDASTEDLPPATNTEVELRLTPAPTGLTKALSSGEAGKPAWDAGVLNHADDAVQFQVSAKLPADVRNYASFTLIDTLPAGLAVEGTPSVDADGADVTGLGTFTAASIVDVEQTGDWEVTVTLQTPDQLLPSSLSTVLGVVVQEEQRKAAGENYGNPDTGVMCTGPLQFTAGDWKQGQSITLTRYDGYWNAERAAKAKEVEIGFVVDPTAIANGLSTGEIQGSYDVPLPALGQLSSSTSGSLYYGEGMQIMAIISTGNGLFGDPAVRRALTRATDRQAIADTVYEGTGTPSRSVVPQAPWDAISGVDELRDEQLPDLSYDIEEAKAELEHADVDLTQPIKIAYPSERSFYADILNEMANGAKELGITLEPTGVPSAQFGSFFSDPAAREGFDGFVTTNYLSAPEPLLHLVSVAKTGSDQNYAGFSDPEIDAALDAALAESDPQRRAELTVEAEALVMEQQPWVPINDLAVRLYMDGSVTGAPASFVYLYYPWAADLGSAE